MAMETARAVREAPWSRATCERASARGLKSARGSKRLRGLGVGDDYLERGREDAACLARQAGPGPRI
jgi:hypothetical protein